MTNDAPRRQYFPHVEGLRGLAAFYVFLFHLVYQKAGLLASPLSTLAPWLGAFQFGHYAVSIFIVISGYCLAFPVAGSTATFDATSFFKRRLRRIYPAYFVALVIALPIFYFESAIAYHHRPPMSHVLIATISHVLLIHNLDRQTLLYLSAPLWSVALEFQIYILFALVLIPVWKKFGADAQLVTALVLSLLPHFLVHGLLDWTCPWFAALFAMGIWAADHTSRAKTFIVPWTWLAAGASVAGVALAVTHNHYELTDRGISEVILPDLVLGVATSCLFIACSSRPTWIVTRALAVRPLQRLGSFSYSLYLIHAPTVALLWCVLTFLKAPEAVWIAGWLLSIPLVLAAAYALFIVAEKPFLSRRLRTQIATAVSDAPPSGPIAAGIVDRGSV